ncbi:MAG: hypothetical protein J6S32_03595, partial [Clostridia bacterium]|nr:hypothetical protein [Clostridia bacterium]
MAKKKHIVVILIALIMTLAIGLTACNDTDENFKVVIHPNNGGIDVEWNVQDPIPTFTRDGYEIEGYYLDGNFASEVSLQTLKETELTADIDIYIKWKKAQCTHQELVIQGEPSSCFEDGLTDGKKCSLCGIILVEQTVIPASHTYTAVCDPLCDLCGWTREVVHNFDNNCDAECNDCGITRTPSSHIYRNDCDNDCEICGDLRDVDHVYSDICDTSCNVCGEVRTVGAHQYDNACDRDCNYCGDLRDVDHVYSDICDTSCNVCGATR